MKKLFLLTAILIGAITANAQILWKVSGNGLEKPSYIFGTHHLAQTSIIERTQGLLNAFKEADAVYGEMDMNLMNTPSMQALLLKAMQAPADSTLSKVLTPQQLSTVAEGLTRYAGGTPISIAGFEQMKPAVLSTTLALLTSNRAFPDFNPAEQLDATIQRMATAEGKTVGGLETPQFQIEMLYGSPISSQVKALLRDLDPDTDGISLARQLAQAYMDADLDRMLELMLRPGSGMDETEADRLIYQRNASWIKILLGLLPTASALIVVGAGHLPGDKGLINMLRNEGFTMTPVDKPIAPESK